MAGLPVLRPGGAASFSMGERVRPRMGAAAVKCCLCGWSARRAVRCLSAGDVTGERVVARVVGRGQQDG